MRLWPVALLVNSTEAPTITPPRRIGNRASQRACCSGLRPNRRRTSKRYGKAKKHCEGKIRKPKIIIHYRPLDLFRYPPHTVEACHPFTLAANSRGRSRHPTAERDAKLGYSHWFYYSLPGFVKIIGHMSSHTGTYIPSLRKCHTCNRCRQTKVFFSRGFDIEYAQTECARTRWPDSIRFFR